MTFNRWLNSGIAYLAVRLKAIKRCKGKIPMAIRRSYWGAGTRTLRARLIV